MSQPALGDARRGVLLRRPRRAWRYPGDGRRGGRSEDGLQSRQEGRVPHLEVLRQRLHHAQRHGGLRVREGGEEGGEVSERSRLAACACPPYSAAGLER